MARESPNRLHRNLTIAASVALYLVVVASSRNARYPFDDEGIVLSAIVSHSLSSFANMCLRGFDNHPPLAYLLLFEAWNFGLPISALHWLSASFTALTLGIWSWICLECLPDVDFSLSIPTALLFSLTPLALGQGDAIRWYPLFAFFVAVAYAIYLRCGSRWWLCAVPLALAADSEFLALLPFFAILIHRYAFRRERISFRDCLFIFITSILALPGLFTAYSLGIFFHPIRVFVTRQIKFSPEAGALANLLGFLGGSRLGISLAWLVLLAAVSATYLTIQTWRLRRDSPQLRNVCQLVAITALLILPMSLSGFGKPRSFLFLAPMLSAIVTIGFIKSIDTHPIPSTGACIAILAVSLGLIANLQISRIPFKRDLAIPYEELIDFVESNARGSTEVFTSDLVAGVLLHHLHNICVAHFEVGEESWTSECSPSIHWSRIIVVKGSPLSETDLIWSMRVDSALRQRELLAQTHFGFDHDYALKNRLTGSSLPLWILSAEVYR